MLQEALHQTFIKNCIKGTLTKNSKQVLKLDNNLIHLSL